MKKGIPPTLQNLTRNMADQLLRINKACINCLWPDAECVCRQLRLTGDARRA